MLILDHTKGKKCGVTWSDGVCNGCQTT
jgi:hypothetical protein